MNRYRVLLPLLVHLEDATYEQGDEFDHEFSEEDELTNLASGLLEIVPRSYMVIGASEVDGHQPGETFQAGIPASREALLVAGGHIQRLVSIAGRTDRSTPIADEDVDEPEPTDSEEK